MTYDNWKLQTPPDTENVNQDEIERLEKRLRELDQLKWDYWVAGKPEKMIPVRRLMYYIDNLITNLKN
jgi:phospholipid N-methyltransferase